MKNFTQILRISTLTFFLLLGIKSFAQVGIGTATPDARAVLDVFSTNKGFLVPRVDIVNLANIDPVTGGATTEPLLVWNTNATSGIGFHYWNGSNRWIPLASAANNNNWTLSGNAGTLATNFLGTTDNVSLILRTNNTERARVLNTGNVGIGLTNPASQLTVNQGSIFNESGGDFDFRIESDTRPNMFFVDASTDRIGINTNAPNHVIDFRTTNENIFLTNWLNDHATNGALARFQHSNANNGSRVVLSTTNYNGNGFDTQGLMGLALNASAAAGLNVRGLEGFNNNENGVGVYGGLSFAGGYAGYAGYFNADVYLGGGLFGPSDIRLKRDIKSFGALSKIKNINPVSYYYDTDKFPGIYEPNKLAYGFLAQEIELIIPEMVKNSEIVMNSNKIKDASMKSEFESEKFKVVNYMTMIPILTQGIKEQQEIIENQNNKIESLEKRLQLLEDKMNQMLKSKN